MATPRQIAKRRFRKTEDGPECPYCDDTGRTEDGSNSCGFCEQDYPKDGQ